jgi:hypothetical protein
LRILRSQEVGENGDDRFRREAEAANGARRVGPHEQVAILQAAYQPRDGRTGSRPELRQPHDRLAPHRRLRMIQLLNQYIELRCDGRCSKAGDMSRNRLGTKRVVGGQPE